MRFVAAAWAALALTACAPDSAEVEAEIEKLARSYLTSTDLAASLEMLDPSGTVTSITGEGTIVRGREAIREYASRHSAQIRSQRVTPGAISVTRIGATHALALAPFSATLDAAPQLILAEGAASFLVVRRDTGWKIVHAHYSYPTLRRP